MALAQPTQYLIVGSTNDVVLSHPTAPPMIDVTTGLAVTNATGTLTLVDSTGANVTGATALAVTYIAGVTGFAARYRSTIPSTVTLTAGTAYTARMTMTDANSNVRLFSLTCAAVASV